jgi:hypothetical protein
LQLQDAEANGEGTDRDERTSDATSSSFRRCKKFTMLISKRNMKADRSMFRPTSGRNGKTRHANKPNRDKTMYGNKETMTSTKDAQDREKNEERKMNREKITRV